MLLLCTCLGGLWGPKSTRSGTGGCASWPGMGLGAVWDGAEPLLLVSSEGLCLPGAVPHTWGQSAALVLVLLCSRASLTDT